MFALPKNPKQRNPAFSVHFTDTLPALTSWSPSDSAPGQDSKVPVGNIGSTKIGTENEPLRCSKRQRQ